MDDLVGDGLVVHGHGPQLVRTQVEVLAVAVHVVGEEAEFCVPEGRLEVAEDELADRSPLLDELAVLVPVLRLQVEGEAQGVVPERVGFHLVAGTFGDGAAMDVGVHPGEGDAVHLRPQKAVRMHGHFLAVTRQVALEDALQGLAVLGPDVLFVVGVGDVLLEGDRHEERGLHLRGAMEQALRLVGDEVVQDLLELLRVVLAVQGQAGEGVEGLAEEAGEEPGITGDDLFLAVGVADQEVRLADELVMERGDGADLAHHALEPPLEAGLRDGGVGIGGEDHGIAAAQHQVEGTGDEEVLAAVETAAHLVGIGHAVVPAGSLVEFARAAHLEVQVRESFVEIEGNAAIDLLRRRAGLFILPCQVMDPAEGQEGLELEPDGGRRFHQLVLDEELVGVLRQDQALAEDDLADLVGDHRDRVGIEVHDVLVPARFIDVPVAVDAQVEPLPAEREAFVQGGQEHVPVTSEPLHRNGQEAVVAARVASHDGRVAIRAGLAREQDFPLQRVGQVDELRLVEFQKSHIRLNYNFFNTTALREGR